MSSAEVSAEAGAGLTHSASSDCSLVTLDDNLAERRTRRLTSQVRVLVIWNQDSKTKLKLIIFDNHGVYISRFEFF